MDRGAAWAEAGEFGQSLGKHESPRNAQLHRSINRFKDRNLKQTLHKFEKVYSLIRCSPRSRTRSLLDIIVANPSRESSEECFAVAENLTSIST